MPDAAAVNRSLGSIRTELQFLADSGVLMPAQFQSIMAQLPVSSLSLFAAFHLPFLLPASATETRNGDEERRVKTAMERSGY